MDRWYRTIILGLSNVNIDISTKGMTINALPMILNSTFRGENKWSIRIIIQKGVVVNIDINRSGIINQGRVDVFQCII